VTRAVLDSSAVIAALRGEPGGELAASFFGQSSISAVNLQEVGKWLFDSGVTERGVRSALDSLNIEVRPHEREDAYFAASLIPHTKRFGRGLGDRSCMALAIRLGVPALTTDREWIKVEVPGLEVELIR